MTDNLKLPSWLSRGIEEYFPIKGTDHTFLEIIGNAKKNSLISRQKIAVKFLATQFQRCDLGEEVYFNDDTSFDQCGNYSMGLTEQAVWPEINMAEVNFNHGMNINFTFENSK